MVNKSITEFQGDTKIKAGTDTNIYGLGDLDVAGTITAGSGLGEVNTVSNVGVSGVNIYKQKTGVDFELKSINTGSSKVTITDDTGNNEIDVDIVEANIVHDNLNGSGTNTHAQIDSHISSTSNPHTVTIDQITPSTTKGDILAEDGSNVVRLAVGTNNKVLVADSAEATGLKWSDDLVLNSLKSGNLDLTTNTLSSTDVNGDINVLPNGTGEVLLKANPSSNLGAATKAYVDSVAGGINWKAAVRVKTVSILPAHTASGTGVGKTLTADANGAFPTIDSINLVANNRILVDTAGTSTGADRGIYTLTTVGDGSNAWVLTRATDADQDAEVTQGMIMTICEGTDYANSQWLLNTANTITVDTTSLEFVLFSQVTETDGTNIGTAGVGIYKQKTGSNIELKKINAGSSKVTVIDDTGNNEIDIDITESNITHNSIGGLTTGDPHTQYSLHTGRIGGQSLIGGTVTGNNLTLESNSSNDGSIILGTANTENVTFNADINSNILPNVDATYNLGSASLAWNNIYTNNLISVATNLTIHDTTVPNTTNTINLGTSSLKWKDIHLSGDIFLDGTVDGRDIATDGTSLDSHIASTSNPHSVTMDQITPTTTKGDIIVENGTNSIRLGVGTNGQVLTADSAEASGVKWANSSDGSSYISIVPQKDHQKLRTYWKFVANFIFPGTVNNSIDNIKAITYINWNGSAGSFDEDDGYSLRIYDITNNNTISTSTVLTSEFKSIITFPTVVNLPVNSSVFELQIKGENDGGKGYVDNLLIKLQ